MEIITTAKLFKNGNSQAVRLPKEFRFEGDEVLISRKGDQVILKPKKKKKMNWKAFFAAKIDVPDDFMNDRDRSLPQERDLF